MPATDYLDEQLLKWAFSSQAFPASPTIYVALFTAAPTKAGGGTEVTGGGYARVQTADSDWNVTGPLWTSQNVFVIDFGIATASWGTVVAFALMDALVGGNMLWFDAVTTSQTVDSGEPAVFNISALQVAGTP